MKIILESVYYCSIALCLWLDCSFFVSKTLVMDMVMAMAIAMALAMVTAGGMDMVVDGIMAMVMVMDFSQQKLYHD
jgi:hypothetical protein